jgi:hypothetical protein
MAFAIAVGALSLTGRLLGEEHELGFFAGRLGGSIGSYPEVVRRGFQMVWLAWGLLFVLAVSPFDPIASRWDEVALGAVAAGVAWRRYHASQQA